MSQLPIHESFIGAEAQLLNQAPNPMVAAAFVVGHRVLLVRPTSAEGTLNDALRFPEARLRQGGEYEPGERLQETVIRDIAWGQLGIETRAIAESTAFMPHSDYPSDGGIVCCVLRDKEPIITPDPSLIVDVRHCTVEGADEVFGTQATRPIDNFAPGRNLRVLWRLIKAGELPAPTNGPTPH